VDFFLIKTSSYFEKTFEPTSEMERKRDGERERERERESVLQKKIKLEMSSFAPGREVDLTMLDEFGPVGTFLFFSVSTFFWIVRHSTKLLKIKLTDLFLFF
jgi:hypothetical protein